MSTGEGDPEYAGQRMEYREEHRSLGLLIGVLNIFPRGPWGLGLNVGVCRTHVDGEQVDKVQGVLTPILPHQGLHRHARELQPLREVLQRVSLVPWLTRSSYIQ